MIIVFAHLYVVSSSFNRLSALHLRTVFPRFKFVFPFLVESFLYIPKFIFPWFWIVSLSSNRALLHILGMYSLIYIISHHLVKFLLYVTRFYPPSLSKVSTLHPRLYSLDSRLHSHYSIESSLYILGMYFLEIHELSQSCMKTAPSTKNTPRGIPHFDCKQWRDEVKHICMIKIHDFILVEHPMINKASSILDWEMPHTDFSTVHLEGYTTSYMQSFMCQLILWECSQIWLFDTWFWQDKHRIHEVDAAFPC